jgi:exosortase N
MAPFAILHQMRVALQAPATRMAWTATALGLWVWAAASLPFWYTYLVGGAGLGLAWLPAPLVLASRPVTAPSWRYLPWALACLLAYPWLHSSLLLFMGSGLSLLAWIEAQGHRVSRLAPIFLGLLSPVPELVIEVFSFSWRLHLSAWTGAVLQAGGWPVTVRGNTFWIEGQAFVIEPACLGLNMMVTGLVATTFLLAQAERRAPWPAWRQGVIYLLALALLVLSNFFRTLMLVLLRSMPGTLSHELTGLFGLLIYVLLPIAGLIWWLSPRTTAPLRSVPLWPQARRWASVTLGILCLISGYHHLVRVSPPAHPTAPPPGWTRLDHGVLRQEADGVLCYRKPPVAAWQAGHSPLSCWQGSGYSLGTIEVETVAGQLVFVAELTQPDQPTLYTAWWYTNGSHRTLDQWEMRWQQARGASPYTLINLTTSSRPRLLAAVEEQGRAGEATTDRHIP